MKIFKRLRIKELKKASEVDMITCPFSKHYGGPVIYTGGRGEFNEEKCKNLCGKLFPIGYEKHNCPCNCMDERYIKERFWKILFKSRR